MSEYLGDIFEKLNYFYSGHINLLAVCYYRDVKELNGKEVPVFSTNSDDKEYWIIKEGSERLEGNQVYCTVYKVKIDGHQASIIDGKPMTAKIVTFWNAQEFLSDRDFESLKNLIPPVKEGVMSYEDFLNEGGEDTIFTFMDEPYFTIL